MTIKFPPPKQLATALTAAVSIVGIILTSSLLCSAPEANAQTSSQIQRGIEHALTTHGGNPTNVYDPFYDDPVPADQLDRPGKILREQPAPHLLNVLGPEFPGYARRILYTSTDVHGRIVPVSGAIFEPANPWRGEGPTPTVVFGPGTRGAGDACAPTRGPWMIGQFNPDLPALGTNYELVNFHAAILLGMRVVVTDLIGLGTPGPHTYVLHTEEGHAMLDAARAGTPKGDPVGFWGYSQGGGASGAAAELASTYAPELNIKGTFAGAPPADIVATMRQVDGSSIMAVIGFALNGWEPRYPGIGDSARKDLSPRGHDFMESTKEACIADSALRWGFQDSRTFTKSGRSISELIVNEPELVATLDAEKLGRRAPTGPIMISTPGNDDLVPSDQVITFARDHCALGAQVTMLDDGLPPLTPGIKLGANHAVGLFAQVAPSMVWLMDRFNGVPAPTNCGAF